jgi:hypothetical protein
VAQISAEQAAWNEHVAWSETAGSLKAKRTWSRIAVLFLTVAGATLQTIAGAVPLGSTAKFAVGVAGSVALVLAAGIAAYLLKPEDTSKWLRARSVSEGIKSEVYSFCAGGDPYDDPQTAPGLLTAKYQEIRDWGKDVFRERAVADLPAKPAPGQLSADDYLDKRINSQIEKYYLPNAKKNARMADQFRFIEVALALLAAALGGVATFVTSHPQPVGVPAFHLGPWVAVLTTVGGSIAAYAAASRYDFQATTFFATAIQLEDLAREWGNSGKAQPSPEWSTFVRKCEEAISAENRSWMAKLQPQAGP